MWKWSSTQHVIIVCLHLVKRWDWEKLSIRSTIVKDIFYIFWWQVQKIIRWMFYIITIKKNCIFPSQWFLIRSALHNPLPIDNTYVGLLLLLVAILQIFELWWILLLTNQKKYIETNTKQHGCGHVQVLYRERIPIIFASNSIQTLWELLHTYAWIQPIAKRWYLFTPYYIDLYFSFMQTSKFWVFLFLIEFEFLEKKRLLGLEQVVVSK